MHYFLRWYQINGKFYEWIVILQEYDLEITTPKSKKALVLGELISNLPYDTKDIVVKENVLDEHILFISYDYPWYDDILIYMHPKLHPSRLSG
jgi:hypothetical protein